MFQKIIDDFLAHIHFALNGSFYRYRNPYIGAVYGPNLPRYGGNPYYQ